MQALLPRLVEAQASDPGVIRRRPLLPRTLESRRSYDSPRRILHPQTSSQLGSATSRGPVIRPGGNAASSSTLV